MINKETLKKKIIYRSKHRGTKEMDMLLGKFVKKHINILKISDLIDLDSILIIEDEILYNWYFYKTNNNIADINIINSLFIYIFQNEFNRTKNKRFSKETYEKIY